MVKNQYGGYSGQLIKQLAAYHELPYGFILKLGSLWWSYNSGGTPTTSVFGGLGTGDGGGTGEDGSDRCNEWFVDPAQANGFGWYDYTTGGNALPGLNLEQQTLGLWPRLIDITHQAITGKKILPTVGSWTPVTDIQSNFTAGFDGSARFLWAGAGYGAFDVGVCSMGRQLGQPH